MITGVTSHKLPSPGLIVPFFILSAVSYLAITVLLFFSSDSFNLHYFHPKLLAITHVAALGFITSIIFGSLYQMFPVLFEVKLKSEILGIISFCCLVSGLSLLSFSFWIFDVGLLFQIGGSLTLLSFLIFALNFYSSLQACKTWKIEFDFVSTSVFWLLLTGLVGLLLVFNFSFPFIPKSHLEVLKMHAHMGLIGWILLLVIGVSARLIPMFIMAKNLNTGLLKSAYYLINIGLILFCGSVYLSLPIYILYVSLLMMEAGVVLFLYFIYKAFKARIRKQLDTGLTLTFGAFVILIAIIPLAMITPLEIFKEGNMMLLRIVYGLLILLGFCGALILGQALKVFPFILWMYRYQQFAGTKKIPMPKDLISEQISKMMMYCFFIGLFAMIVFVLFKNITGISIGAVLLICSALLFNINIVKALFYKIK